jgi:hypothetical protein
MTNRQSTFFFAPGGIRVNGDFKASGDSTPPEWVSELLDNCDVEFVALQTRHGGIVYGQLGNISEEVANGCCGGISRKT